MAANSSETSSQLAWDKDLVAISCVNPWGEPGAYTTLRLDGKGAYPLFLGDHLVRLQNCLARLEVICPFKIDLIRDKIESIAALRTEDNPSLLRVSVLEDRLQLETRSLPFSGDWMEGRLLSYVRKNPEAKSLDNQLFDHVTQLNRASEEALLLAPDGQLGEGSTSNLIFAQGDVLVSPETNVLPGITLAKLLPALAEQYKVIRRPVHLKELTEFTEIIATGSGKEVVGFARIAEVGWRARDESVLTTAVKLYGEIKSQYLSSHDA